MNRSTALPGALARTSLLGALLISVTGCARADNGERPPSLSSPSMVVDVRYTLAGSSSEGPIHGELDVTTDGAQRVRLHSRIVDVGENLSVYDGHRLLVHDTSYAVPYMLYEAPSEHPDAYQPMSLWRLDPTSGSFRTACTGAHHISKVRTIADRPATGYTCRVQHDRPEALSGTVWLDQETGVLLELGGLRARAVTMNAPLAAGTFSTDPPAGVKVDLFKARHASASGPEPAPAFSLRLLGGGTVGRADLEGRPFVLAFYSSDLYFGGETCPRCVPSLLHLQQLTAGGAHPAVLLVQNGEEGKPGAPFVPEGITLRTANDPDASLEHSYGLAGLVGFAFVNADGTIDRVFDGPATTVELADAVETLR